MSDLPPKGTPSLVIIISDSLIVASRILRLAVSFYSNHHVGWSFMSSILVAELGTEFSLPHKPDGSTSHGSRGATFLFHENIVTLPIMRNKNLESIPVHLESNLTQPKSEKLS